MKLNKIFIEEDKEFTIEEFSHLIARAMRSLATIPVEYEKDITYSRDDVFFTIVDILGYINERTPGRFRIDQMNFQNYLIRYIPPTLDKRKGMKSLLMDTARTAIVLHEQTGRFPVWAQKNEAMMDLIAAILKKREAAPSDNISKRTLEERASTAVQIYQITGRMPEWVSEDPQLQEQVDILIKEDNDEPSSKA